MTAQTNGTLQPPLYTIEQIELVRRLRNSGLTKEQLVQAFDSLDRLDRELGPVYTIPLSMSQQAAFLQQAFQLRPLFSAPNIQANPLHAAALRSPMPPVVTTLPQVPTVLPVNSRKRSIDSVDSGSDCNGLNSSLDLSSNANGYTDQLDELEEKEFVDFVGKGEAYCCEEIRNFVIQYSIKQQQIATLSGISQSYVSRYLKGDFYDMSERSRRAIQKWFIVYRKNPAAIAPAVNAILLSNGPTPKKLVNNLDLSQDFTCYPKRERFVFRPNHIEILERCFQEDSYPTYEKREEIARSCNTATEAMAGRELADKEKVTVQVVSNWFANKRKEMKKIAREEGLDVSQVPLRPRGRPPRVLSDIIAHLTQTQGHMTLPEDPIALVAGAQQLVLPPSQDCTAENMATVISQQQQQAREAAKPQQPSPQGTSTISTTTTTTTTTTTNGHHQKDLAEPKTEVNGQSPTLHTPDPHEDQNLSLSVELAAVNQAILSLTGQQPIGLKQEKAAATAVGTEDKV